MSASLPSRPAEALDVDLVVERSGGDQFHAPLVGEHVGEGQAELGVAVDSRLGTALLGAVQLDVGTAVVGIDGGEAATDDEVTGLVSLNIRSGERGGDGEGQQEAVSQDLRMMSSIPCIRKCWCC